MFSDLIDSFFRWLNAKEVYITTFEKTKGLTIAAVRDLLNQNGFGDYMPKDDACNRINAVWTFNVIIFTLQVSGISIKFRYPW
jgi:hypothetical protein